MEKDLKAVVADSEYDSFITRVIHARIRTRTTFTCLSFPVVRLTRPPGSRWSTPQV